MNSLLHCCRDRPIKGFKDSPPPFALMGECELCGAVKVGVRSVRTGKTEVTACTKCIDRMNLLPKSEAPGLIQARQATTRQDNRPRKNNIMTRSEKDLADDFSQRITNARKQRNWTQQQLAKRMAETANIIKAAENGKRPTDSVIRKFERTLSIKLMVEHTPNETRQVKSGPSRGMTFGDYLNDTR